MTIKPAGKLALLLVAVGVAFGGYRLLQSKGVNLAPDAVTKSSSVPKRADLPPEQSSSEDGSGTNAKLPSDRVVSNGRPEVRFLHWAWNAQMGLMLANGGKATTEGSLMAENGVNLKLIRQDDASKMQEELVAFARALKNGEPNPSTGAHFVAIMGDGSAAFLKSVNDILRKIGPDYTAKVVASLGYSYGEDKFMGPSAWRATPSASKGGVVAGYLRDGDWNIAMKWLGDNGLRNNPDEKTYDPDALNWVAANDYLDACEKYISGYSETRPVVRNGKPTGETKQIKVDGVVTWTPGDVNVATKKGGVVSIVSTREYASQMPCTVIGIDRWMKNNRSTVEKMLNAIYTANSQVRTSGAALTRASKISNDVYGESDTTPEYWKKYYAGTIEKDAKGIEVELGGSKVSTLADAMRTFGLVPGTQNLFAATYTVFGNVVKDQYPDILPNFDPVGMILDTSYVEALAKRSAPTSTEIAETKPKFEERAPITKKISQKSWAIQFDTGQASFSSGAKATMQKLLRDLLVASDAKVEIQGHTDNVGDPAKNMQLSEARAFAVKKWLENVARENFPEGRIQVKAFGQTNPVAENNSAEGKAKNRRVVIIIGKSE